jgi:hypothetical protein
LIKYGVTKLNDQLITALETVARLCVCARISTELISAETLQQTAPRVGAWMASAKFMAYATKYSAA